MSWDLRFEPHAGEVAYLPARWLYDRRVPRSNGAALVPAASAPAPSSSTATR